MVGNNRYEYCVYVIELNGDPMHVYVGQTCLTPEERFIKHRSGVKAARCVKNARTARLRPELYLGLKHIKTRSEALASEALLAAKLLAMGFTVKGGH